MKLISSFLCLTVLIAAESHATALDKKNFNSWPGARVNRYGCFLEKSFGYRDKRFNCSLKGYVNQGDPCKNTKAYAEGPEFPDGKVKQVHPLIESIALTWEHGELQGVSVALTKKVTEAEARKTFALPATASVQDCSTRQSCIVIQAFDHMGAGDVDCGAE